jgi:RNA polymerase sigma-70 factor (ECF subfamily)
MKGPDNSSNSDGKESQSSLTSATLIEKVKQGERESWERLMKLYRQLVLWWCRGKVACPEDAEEVTQEVFTTVFTNIGEFTRRQEGGGFRAWMRAITRNKLGDYLRRACKWPTAVGGSDAQAILVEVPADDGEASSADECASERVILVRSALEQVRSEFEPNTWNATLRTAVEGQPAADVAAALGMTPAAVYIAKSRVLARLRQELGDLLD